MQYGAVNTTSRGLANLAALAPPIARLRQQRDDLAARVRDLEADSATAHVALQEEADRRALAEETVRSLQDEVAVWHDRLGGADNAAYWLYPPGHFYSPQPLLEDVRAAPDRRFGTAEVVGVDVRLDDQVSLLRELRDALGAWPYGRLAREEADRSHLRFRPDNGFFGWTDSQVWSALLRTWRPARILEIGSGWSTALVLDTLDDLACDVELTCVEPYPERLLSVLRPGDEDRIRMRPERVQDVDLSVFEALEAGDVLFIDSTHVAKHGSDVNYLVLEVLPRLRPGVHVHVHDVAYPFEYPKEWLLEGRAWNEAYLLRAFLVDNPHWQIDLWPSALLLCRPPELPAALDPDTEVDGGSLWLTRR